MRIKLVCILLLLSFFSLPAQEVFQLAPPLMKYASGFFKNKMEMELRFAQAGSSVFYTLNGEEPTENDLLYKHPILISDKSVTLKAKSFGKSFFPSETISATFIKQGIDITGVVSTDADKPYTANGSESLTDNIGGFADINKNSWLGYKSDSIKIELKLKKRKKVSEVLINFLQSEGSWIFLPEEIRVSFYDKKQKQFMLLGNKLNSFSEQHPGSHSVHQIIDSKNKIKTDRIVIDIRPLNKIPDWHPGKGNHGWCFIDEIKIY